jgi:hypothetical protein
MRQPLLFYLFWININFKNMKRIDSIILFALFAGALFAHEGHDPLAKLQEVNFPVAPVVEIQTEGSEKDTYTFHFYTADGNLYEGHTEIFIALKDKKGNGVEEFSVSNLSPIMHMDMGMSHSTPVGKVEKVENVEGQSLYTTWIAGLMGGDWELGFDYTIGEKSGTIEGTTFPVSKASAGQKGIQSFGAKLYASIAYPQSYIEGGAQVLKAYINRNVVGTEPYQIVEGGYKIVVTPNLDTTTLPADTLLWNAQKGIYEGQSVVFSEGGLWTLYFKVLDAQTNELIENGGDNGTESNRFWKINVKSGEATGIKPIINNSDVKVYPTFTTGVITVEAPVGAQVNVFSISGQRLQRRTATTHAPLTLNLTGKGFYLINIQTIQGEVITRKVVVK